MAKHRDNLDLTLGVADPVVDLSCWKLLRDEFGARFLKSCQLAFIVALLGRKIAALREVWVRMSGCAQHAEHQEHREEKQCDRRHEASALTIDITPSELARPPREHWQGPPDLAFEMEDAMSEIVEEGAKCPVNVGMLPAFVTIWAAELAPQFRHSVSVVCPGAASPAFGSTARPNMPPVTASPIASKVPTINHPVARH